MSTRWMVGLGLLLSTLLHTMATAQPRVVVSILPVHSLTAALMRGRGEPTLLWSGARSPHQGALKPSEMRTLHQADLVIWVGPSLEGALIRPLATVRAGGQERILTLLEVLPRERLLPVRHAGHSGEEPAGPSSPLDREGNPNHPVDWARVDPHFWLDPTLAIAAAERIAERLIARDPDGADQYRRNLQRLRNRLEKLDAKIQETLEPVRSIPFLVFHDAYQYFEAHYHLRVIGAVATDPDRPPGARRIRELRRLIQEKGVHCVFVEPQFTPKVVQVLTEGLPVTVEILDPLGTQLLPGRLLYERLLTRLAETLRNCLAQPAEDTAH